MQDLIQVLRQEQRIANNSENDWNPRKEGMDGVKSSADIVSIHPEFGIIAKSFCGVLGVVMSVNAISEVIDSVKKRKHNLWLYPRIIFEFTTSGILIGYVFNNLFTGMIIGMIVGFMTLLFEIITLKKKQPLQTSINLPSLNNFKNPKLLY